jgi:Tfp pilus assembly protein PilF
MKILVVDDLSNMRKTLRNMLRYIGFENIEEADDGDTGLQKLGEAHFDMVVADWVMPRVSGIEMLRMARERPNLKDVPFLMVTAEVDAGQIVQAAETEVDGYIIKPFVARTLEEKILSILKKKKNPSELQLLFQKAEILQEKGDSQAALRLLERAQELSPKSARTRQVMGSIYEKMGDLDKAEELYKDAAAVNPQFVKVHQSLGELYDKKGEPEKAAKALEAAVEISPNNPDRLTLLGKAYLENGNVEKAQELFKAAIKHDPKNPDRHTAIGEIFLKAGHENMAADSFQGSLELKQDVNVYNRLGIALRRKGKFKEAIVEYKKALKVDPNDEVLYYNLGRVFMQDQNFMSARKAFNKALAVDPKFEDAKRMLEKLDEKGT